MVTFTWTMRCLEFRPSVSFVLWMNTKVVGDCFVVTHGSVNSWATILPQNIFFFWKDPYILCHFTILYQHPLGDTGMQLTPVPYFLKTHVLPLFCLVSEDDLRLVKYCSLWHWPLAFEEFFGLKTVFFPLFFFFYVSLRNWILLHRLSLRQNSKQVKKTLYIAFPKNSSI